MEKEREKEKDDKEQKKKRPPGRDTSDEAMMEKDILWDGLFHVSKVAAPSRVKNNRIRFGHHLTTDGVSVSAVVYHEGSAPKKKKKRKKKKQFQQVHASEGVDCREACKYADDDDDDVEVVGVDPGKHNLVFMSTEQANKSKKRKSGTSLRYTAAQGRHP